MSYLLLNRLNKIEQHQKAMNPSQAHFLRESEWLEHKEKIEALKEGESITIEVRERKIKFQEDDDLIVIKKRIQRDDVIFVDNIFDEVKE